MNLHDWQTLGSWLDGETQGRGGDGFAGAAVAVAAVEWLEGVLDEQAGGLPFDPDPEENLRQQSSISEKPRNSKHSI